MYNYYSCGRRIRMNLRQGRADPTTKLIEAAYPKIVKLRQELIQSRPHQNNNRELLNLNLPIQTWGAFQDLRWLFAETGIYEVKSYDGVSVLLQFGMLTTAQAEHQIPLKILGSTLSSASGETIKISVSDLASWSNDAYPEGLDVIAWCHKNSVTLTKTGIDTILARLTADLELDLGGDLAPLELIFNQLVHRN